MIENPSCTSPIVSLTLLTRLVSLNETLRDIAVTLASSHSSPSSMVLGLNKPQTSSHFAQLLLPSVPLADSSAVLSSLPAILQPALTQVTAKQFDHEITIAEVGRCAFKPSRLQRFLALRSSFIPGFHAQSYTKLAAIRASFTTLLVNDKHNDTVTSCNCGTLAIPLLHNLAPGIVFSKPELSRKMASTEAERATPAVLSTNPLHINNGGPSLSPVSTSRLENRNSEMQRTGGHHDGQELQQSPRYYRGVNIDAIPMLPEDIRLTYLAEGAANIIYRFSLATSSSVPFEPGIEKTHLLRLRKALPSGSPNLPAFAALQNIFFPLLPKELILDTRLVQIPAGLIERENRTLREREASGARLAKRAGLYLVGPPPPPGTPVDEDGEKVTTYERYGFLVEDMTPSVGVSEGENKSRRRVLVEFKPKWLLQSPNAAPDSKRCRTCALRISKEYKKHGITVKGNGVGTQKGYWCSFDLASGEPGRVRLAVRGILSQKGAVATGWTDKSGAKGKMGVVEEIVLEDKVVGYFTGPKGIKLLQLLKRYQAEWDPKGAMGVFGKRGDKNLGSPVPENSDSGDGEWGDEWSDEVKKYLMAMTIRDLTLFLRVDLSTSLSADDSVTTRIGDLDLKSCENGKSKYWVDTERELRQDGWYTGTERDPFIPDVSRRMSVVGDKRKFDQVDGKVVHGRKRNGENGEPVEVVVERNDTIEESNGHGVDASMEEGEGGVRWCVL